LQQIKEILASLTDSERAELLRLLVSTSEDKTGD